MYERVIFGPLVHEENRHLTDLTSRELVVLVPVVVLCFAMGLYPAPFLTRMQPSIDRTLARVNAAQRMAPAVASVVPR
jgi:NADH-quinone oxidoreductase subunit M